MTSTTSSQVFIEQSPEQVPPPPGLNQDDSHGADAAHQRLATSSGLSRILSFWKLRLRSKPSRQNLTQDASSEILREAGEAQALSAAIAASAPDHTSIILNDNAIKADYEESKDRYEWAVVYENQRGMTLFSIPYYSALSLLPTDPLAFTLPNASQRRSKQPAITLSTFPLPDGNWRWVSRAWMIDMRSDTGIVQHDGFEYNWVFRRHKWRAEVGFLSAGGWVRRRRWVRLMMRPGKAKSHTDSEGSTSSGSLSSSRYLLRQSMASSNLTSLTDLPHVTVESVWHGNEDDWKRCRLLMLRYGRDGRKIDLWRTWLGYYHPTYQDQFVGLDGPGKGKGRQKQWTEDDGLLPSQLPEPDAASHQSMTPPPREYIAPVLHKHGYDIFQLFVYPDSRVQFLKLLGKAGLLSDLGFNVGRSFSASEVEFWSYTNELEKELEHLDTINTLSTPETSSSLLPAPQQLSDNEI